MRLSPLIQYPVFILPKDFEIEREGSRVYIVTPYSISILDDTSLPGTYASRRLKLLGIIADKKEKGFEHIKLTKVIGAIYTEEQLIAYLTKRRNYVDSTGRIFRHAPTTFYKLTYHKVLRAAIVEGSHTVIWLKGINTPFKINRAITSKRLYAGILRLPNRNILYELVSNKKPDTRRKL